MASADCAARARFAAAMAVAAMASVFQPPVRTEGPVSLVHRQRYSMGTMVDVLVYHHAPGAAARAADAALAEILRLDKVMSHFREDSDLSTVGRKARHAFAAAHADLYEVIRLAQDVSARSGGAFDITAGPLIRAWAHARSERRQPTGGEMAAARDCAGYDKIELKEPDRIRLNSPCVELDLGGIGKGYAVDRAIAVLRSAGIRDALVNAGGSSIAALGHPPGGPGWPVAAGRGAHAALLLSGGSVSTSQQALPSTGPGPWPPVIVDPRDGTLPPRQGRVTVAAPSAALSDALSTTLIVLPRERAAPLLREIEGVAALWFSPDGRLESTYRESLLRFAKDAP